MPDCIPFAFLYLRFGCSPFPSLSDCGKVNRGWIGAELMRVAVTERRHPGRVVGDIGAAEGSKA